MKSNVVPFQKKGKRKNQTEQDKKDLQKQKADNKILLGIQREFKKWKQQLREMINKGAKIQWGEQDGNTTYTFILPRELVKVVWTSTIQERINAEKAEFGEEGAIARALERLANEVDVTSLELMGVADPAVREQLVLRMPKDMLMKLLASIDAMRDIHSKAPMQQATIMENIDTTYRAALSMLEEANAVNPEEESSDAETESQINEPESDRLQPRDADDGSPIPE